ncbi:MAG: acyl-CoA thioesterase [Saprospiraceae bacterium]|nr:acyl-CoA thioesterase [Saprospiraceae bacterium]
MTLKAKQVSESRTTMTELVMPNDTNPLGNLMGGNLMRWMDIASGICAAKHCDAYGVTASVDHVSFKQPIRLGDIVTVTATVTRAFNTSVEVYVEVFANDMLGTYKHKSNHAYFTFVALDSQTAKPTPVPPVMPLTNEEEQLYEGASRRRELRLILSKRIKPSEAREIKDYFAKMD